MAQSQVLTRYQKRTLKDSVFKATSVKQDQITQQQQSFAMVRTLLLSSVATISWLRQLFPKDCYKKRSYADMQDDGQSLYHTFHNTTSFVSKESNPEVSPVGAQKSWVLRVLARGKTRGADKLLDWVNAVIEGILRDDLSSVQFSIYTDKDNPLNILESYMFSFHYHKDLGSGTSRLVGLEFSESDGEPVTIRSARSGLARIIDRLLVMDIRLPVLPANRFMICHLFHRPNKSTPHLPQGFQPCQNPAFWVPDNESWHTEERDLGLMKSGFHDVNLKILYMAHEVNARVQYDAVIVPQKMRHNKPLLQTQTVFLGVESTAQASCSDTQAEGSTGVSRVSSEIRAEQEDEDYEFQTEPYAIKKRRYSESHSSLQQDGLVPTQELSQSSLLENRPQHWVLKFSISKELEIKRKKVLSSRFRNILAGDEYTIRCECGIKEEEGKMMQCQCCDAKQHYHCYGFTMEDPRDQHFCYQCLLADSDGARLDKLKRLAPFRRALWMVYNQGYTQSHTAFAKILRYDINTTLVIVQRMKDEGYLALDENNELVLVHSSEQTKIRDLEYFNPMTLIKICYTLRDMDDGSDDSIDTSITEPRQSHSSRKRRGCR